MNYSSITLARDKHHPKALLLLIIFINPPISSIQQWRKLLLQFSTHFGDPHNPITFLPPNRLCSFVSPRFILSTTPETQYTCTSTQSHTHTHPHTHWYTGTGTNRQERTHTPASLVCVGGLSVWHRGTVIMYFLCSSQREEIRGPADYSKARHHSSWMGRDWWSGGCGGDSGCILTFSSFNLLRNHFSNPWSWQWRLTGARVGKTVA